MPAEPNALPLKRLAEERKKKRIAQKLCRVRKKDELHELESQLAQVEQKVVHLTAENHSLRQKVRVLSDIISCRDSFIAGLSKLLCHPNSPLRVSQSDAPADGTAGGNDPDNPEDSPWQTTRISAEEVSTQWKAFLSELSVVMLGCDEGQYSADVEAKINQLYKDKLVSLRCVYFMDQLCFLQVISFNLELWKPVPAGEDHWAAVVEAVNLTEQQKQDMVDAFEVCLKFVEKLHPCRKQLLDKVLAVCETSADVNAAASPLGLGRWAHYQCLEHAEKLHQLIKQEIDVTVLMSAFLHRSLSVVQRARLAIQSYPFLPDAFSIMTVLCQQVRGSQALATSAEASNMQ